MSPWPTAAIGDVAEIVSGATPKTGGAAYWDGGVPWATPRDLSSLEGPTIASTERTLTSAGLASCAASLLPAGSLLLSSRAPIGHVAVNTVPMATNQGFKSLVPHKGLLEAKYAYHWLRANKAYLESLGNGATFKELSKAALSRVSIPLPPMEEQRRIAAILDQTDVLSAKRRAAIAGLTDAQGALLSVFAPPDRTALRRIGDLAGVQTGPFGSLLHQADYVEGGIPLVNPVHIVDGRIRTDPKNAVKPDKWERLGSYHLQAGDVVLARRGEMGRAAVVTKSEAGFLCGTGSMIIRAHAGVVHPVYLAAALSSLTSRDRLLRVSLGTTLPNLNSKIVEDFELPVPAYEAQMAFAEAMSEVDQIRGRMDQSLDALGDLASSLATSAFKGEL